MCEDREGGHRIPHLHSTINCPAGNSGQDRVKILDLGDRLIIALADGAGGTGGGAAAADRAIACATTLPADLRQTHTPDYWASRLRECDAIIAGEAHGGQTTLVVASIFQNEVVGAAVGDSIAWIIDGQSIQDLTSEVPRKPLLGDGAARPYSFGPVALGSGTLLIATDGLWKYAPRPRIAETVRTLTLPGPLDALVDLVRLRSGAFQDDVAVAVIRQS